LDDPTLRQLEVPAVLRADGYHDPSRFPGFENDHYVIFVGLLKSKDRQSHHAFPPVHPEPARPISGTGSYPVLKKFEKIIVDV